jgi:hypothetical protein
MRGEREREREREDITNDELTTSVSGRCEEREREKESVVFFTN